MARISGWKNTKKSVKGAVYTLLVPPISGMCFYAYDSKAEVWVTEFTLKNNGTTLVDEKNVFDTKQEAYSWCIEFMEETSEKLRKRGGF